MKRQLYHIILLLIIPLGMAHAQISPLADQFLLNPVLMNSALTGSGIGKQLTVSARQQWLGMTGAPSWQSAAFHTILNSKKQHFNPRGFVNKGENAFGNIGIGGGLFNVRYGAISQVGLHMNYAYHVFLAKGRLSFGLAPMYQQFLVNKNGFIPPDGTAGDPLIDRDALETVHFVDANAGVHYYNDQLFAGFSAVQLFNSGVSFGELSFLSMDDFHQNAYLARTLFLYFGMTPRIGKNLVLEPSLTGRYNPVQGPGFTVSFRATINRDFQAGILYRFKESAGLFVGVRFGDLLVRYQFEAPIGTAVQTRFTTNQILAGYYFN